MTLDPTSPRHIATPGFRLAVALIAALTVVRLVGLHLSVVDLYFDEAQYWDWSRHLAFGYFSKPPLLAWIIHAATSVCGDGEACVRSTSPLLYFATSLIVYAIADALYGREAGFWSALTFALLLGVSFSARIISTDVPLLLFWAAALLAFIKLKQAPDWRWTLVFGVTLGLGLLAKYAMIYFALCAAVAAWLDRDVRALLRRRHLWIAAAIALAILSPNVIWNLANGLVTLRHTGDNISGGGLRFRPLDAVAFLAAQFAVASPFVFAAFLLVLGRSVVRKTEPADRLLLAFAVPPLALVTAASFFRGAHANWAAPALVSATVLAVAWWVRHGQRHWLAASLAVGLAVQAALIAGDAFADRISVPGLGHNADLYRSTLGWRALGAAAERAAEAIHAPTVAAEGRAEVAALSYYLRDKPRTVVSWQTGAVAQSGFDRTQALDDAAAEPVLLITSCPDASRLAPFFADVTTLAPITARSGPTSARHYYAFKLDGRRRPIAPLAACGSG